MSALCSMLSAVGLAWCTVAPIAQWDVPRETVAPFPRDVVLGAPIAPELLTTNDDAQSLAAAAQVGVQAAGLTGWGLWPTIRVPMSQPVRVPEHGEEGGVWLVEAAHPWRSVPIDVRWDARWSALLVRSRAPLAPGVRYAIFVTRSLEGLSGIDCEPSEAFERVVFGPTVVGLTAEELEARQRIRPVIHRAKVSGFISSFKEVVVVDTLTTGTPSVELMALAGRVHTASLEPGDYSTEPTPLLPWLTAGSWEPGSAPWTAFWQSSILGTNTERLAIGWFTSRDVRTQGVFDSQIVEGNAPALEQPLGVWATIPHAAAPANGYPVILSFHAAGADGARAARSGTNVIEKTPAIVVGISAPYFGERPDVGHYVKPDAIAKTRDGFRQAIVDYLLLRQAILRARAHGVWPFANIDPSKFYVRGGSLGAVQGALFALVSPDASVATMTGGGVSLPDILFAQEGAAAQFAHTFTGQWITASRDSISVHDLLNDWRPVLQALLDPADPLAYAYRKRGAWLWHDGVHDRAVAGRLGRAARAVFGLADRTGAPCMSNDGCDGAWTFRMPDFSDAAWQGHGSTYRIDAATNQVAQFYASGGTKLVDALP